jgi:hypothetical protein
MKGVKAASKNGGTDRELAVEEHLGHQRPDRADEDDEGRDRQQDVVGHQRRFAADTPKTPLASIAPARSANSAARPR